MKRGSIGFILGAILSFALMNRGSAQVVYTGQVKRFIELNNTGKFEEARDMFAPAIQPQLGPDILKNSWEEFNQQFGRFKRVINMEVLRADTFRHVRTICDFERAEVTFYFTFDTSSHELYGFIISDVKEKGKKTSKPKT